MKNAPLIQEILKNNKHIQGNLITQVAWIHGVRSQTAGKKRSSLIVYLATEEARDRVVKDGLTIKGLWHHVKLWAQTLHSPRCFKCNRWGHTQTAWASQTRCGHCAGPHNTKDCTQPKKSSCVNCGRRHKAFEPQRLPRLQDGARRGKQTPVLPNTGNGAHPGGAQPQHWGASSSPSHPRCPSEEACRAAHRSI